MQLLCSISVQLPCDISVQLACSISVQLPCNISVQVTCGVNVQLPWSISVQVTCSINVQFPCSISLQLSCRVSVHLSCSISVHLNVVLVRNVLYKYKWQQNYMYGCECTRTCRSWVWPPVYKCVLVMSNGSWIHDLVETGNGSTVQDFEVHVLVLMRIWSVWDMTWHCVTGWVVPENTEYHIPFVLKVSSPHSPFFTEMKAPQCLLVLGTVYVKVWG